MMAREALLCLVARMFLLGLVGDIRIHRREHHHSKSCGLCSADQFNPKMRTNNSATGRNGSTGDANNCRDNSNGRDTHTDTHNKACRRSRLARKLQPPQWRARPRPDRR